MQPPPPKRPVTLSEDQLGRWNHIRSRAGFGPVDMDAAVKRLTTMPEEVFKEAMERIGADGAPAHQLSA